MLYESSKNQTLRERTFRCRDLSINHPKGGWRGPRKYLAVKSVPVGSAGFSLFRDKRRPRLLLDAEDYFEREMVFSYGFVGESVTFVAFYSCFINVSTSLLHSTVVFLLRVREEYYLN